MQKSNKLGAIGSIFGSIAGTAVVIKFIEWVTGKNTVSDDHIDSMQRQADMRQQHHKETKAGVEILQSHAKKATESVQEVTTSTNELVGQLGTIINLPAIKTGEYGHQFRPWNDDLKTSLPNAMKPDSLQIELSV